MVLSKHTTRRWSRLLIHAAIAILCLVCGAAANAQQYPSSPQKRVRKARISETVRTGPVRSKVNDRGAYQPPTLAPANIEPVSIETNAIAPTSTDPRSVEPVSHDVIFEGPVVSETYSESYSSGEFHDSIVSLDGCDSMACDGCGACDCVGGCGRSLSNGRIFLDRDHWFGSVELLLMERRGDLLPPLVTTGPSDDDDTAGQLDQDDTSILFGGATTFKDTTAGVRVNLGTYLDSNECRSLVLRGWYGGNDKTGFNATNREIAVLARPINDVSDGSAATPDTSLIAFPGRSFGSVTVTGESEVYGADFSIRQYLKSGLGGSLDFLYGYQFMRLDESIGIRSSSTSLTDDVGVIGGILSIEDSFETTNDFHGGQIGLAGNYREGCWSFDYLAKVGFGSLRRTADLRGQTTTQVDTATAVDNQGLLVRDSNSGKTTDHTFGWVPELDFTLGYHRFPGYDMTIGYHVIALTDAIRPGETMDQTLQTNLSDPLVGAARPLRQFDFETFYVQGIHFGIAKRY